MASNGQLPRNALAPVPGGELLRKDAARAYTAFNRYLESEHGVSLAHAGSGALYRKLGRPGDYRRGGEFTQWYAWERYQAGGNLAAYPGTSNHGLGVAVDFSNYDVVARYGKMFGFMKTEAFGEPWHYCYVAGRYSMVERWAAPRKGDTFGPGDRGPALAVAKKNLKRHGYWPWPLRSRAYSKRFAKQIRKFQKDRFGEADGIVGPATWKKLFAKKQKRKASK